MVNLKKVLAEDIAAGIQAAITAKALAAPAQMPQIVVEHPENPEHGDYASPIALALTKQVGQPPMTVVAAIAEHMPKKEYIGKLEAVAPGFLNIRLNPGWFTIRLDDIIEQDLYQHIAELGQGQRINLEFISANPTGPLTLGNTRTAFSVDALANVLSRVGYGVTREYYINDAGAQIKKLGESVLRRILQEQGQTVEYPDELYQGDYIVEVARTIAEEWRENEGKEFEINDLENTATLQLVSRQALELLLGDIKHVITDDLKITFDVWTSEQALRDSGKIETIIERLKEQGRTYTKEGALYLKTTDFGDSEDRVLVKSDGEYAYIAPDIAYHQDKYDRGFDHILTFVGADHQGHAPKLTAAMEALGNDTTKLKIIAAQWMRFISDGQPVKLSKRRGNIVTPKDLIGEVGYDASRFFMIQHALTTHMDFDLDLARERSERNPVYYVQYAYVRLQSILRKAKQEGIIGSVGEEMVLTSQAHLTDTAELNLMRQLYRYPEELVDAAQSFTVHGLCYYALDLARSIHVFYKRVPVLAAADQTLIASRLQLVMATRKVLAELLGVLGISKPEVM